MSERYYLTTPLYYVNSKPHIGHSYTNIASDALARYKRMRLGKDQVHFLTGTDEHGQKIDRAARDAGMSPKDFTDKISRTFVDLWKTLNISYDDFIRTTETRHKRTVEFVWEKLRKAEVSVNGRTEKALYKHTYDGYYCVSCETFITEGLLDPNNPALCPDCKRPLEQMKEETYFFRMSAYQERLMKDVRDGTMKILPESRRNEVLGFLEHNKLQDLSVSRPKSRLSWGIPLPFDAEHVTYVWLDALVNYISACGYGREEKFSWWPADVHVIGKDIIRHHAVIWPALLYALELELPKMIFAHGWWVQGGEKMSKSRGNVTDPVEIVKTYGVDAYRYFLLRETAFGQDGTFSEEALILRYNTDLANDLGNLLHRTLTMCEKYFEGRVPGAAGRGQEKNDFTMKTAALIDSADGLVSDLDPLMERLAFSEALERIWKVIDLANKYIEFAAPWKMWKENKTEEVKILIAALHHSLKAVSEVIEPFMPTVAGSMKEQLGIGASKIEKGAPIFPRIESK